MSSPDPIYPKEPFQQASKLSGPEETRIAIENTGDPHLKARYDFLQENKATAIESLERQFEKERDVAVEALTLQKLNERLEKPYLEYRPADLPANEQETLRKAARQDAEVAYEVEQSQAVERIEERYENHAKRLLDQHERLAQAPRPKQSFNEHSQNQSHGQSR